VLATQSFKTALVVEGGALRGVFSTGLLDGFLEAQFNPFDFYIGVSSGASNLAAYLAEMRGRNGRIFMDYSLRPEFINITRCIRGGHLMDLDWLWDITIREIRLDLAAIYSKHKPFITVITDIQTGRAVYKVTSAEDLEHVLKASSAMPVFYRGYPKVEGRPMTDGGVNGCDSGRGRRSGVAPAVLWLFVHEIGPIASAMAYLNTLCARYVRRLPCASTGNGEACGAL